MKFPSAQILRAQRVRPKLLMVTLVTLSPPGDYVIYYLHRPATAVGGHKGIAPPSKAGTWATDAATNVPTSPIIRTAILITFFMGSLSCSATESSKIKAPKRTGIIKHLSIPL